MLGHRKLSVEDYVAILKRRWWIIAIPVVILPIVAVAATYFITPEYVSSALILIDQQKVPGEFVKPVATEALDSRLAYMTEQILSRSSIEPIIRKYNLYGDQHVSMDARVDMARKALHIEGIQSEIARSNGLPGFKITFKANDPNTAQQVCADITSLFTAANIKSRQGQATDTTDFLQGQLNDAKRNLDDQDAKVAAFQRQYFGELPGDENNNMGIMSSLNSRLDATTQAIQTLEQNKSVGEALLAQAPVNDAAPAPAATTQAPREEELELQKLLAQKADLESRYTADYPEVKDVNRQITELRAEIAKQAATPAPVAASAPRVNRPDSPGVITLKAQLHGIDVQIAAKQKEQDDLKRQIQSYEGKIQSSPQVAAQYKEITRDYDAALAFYNKLSEQMKVAQETTSLENHQEGETFTTLDSASLPTDPVFPKQSAFGFGGLAFGLALGLAIVALLEYKDTALRNEREVWDFLHLPTLAVIAWSGEAVDAGKAKAGMFKRLFSRKPAKDLLADARG
jgi:polysaccharide chain length determinant protein (PEP-CTERM system associated)